MSMSKKKSAGFLSEKQRQQLEKIPEYIDEENLIQYFTLSSDDLSIIPVRSPPYSRLGFSLSLCALRFIGFIPEVLDTTPKEVVLFLIKQLELNLASTDLIQYGSRAQTKTGHASIIERHLGFKRITDDYQITLKDWLLSRAMEHDRPTLLLNAVLEKLKRERIVRPTLAKLERIIGSVRDKARYMTYRYMSNILSDQCKSFLVRPSILVYRLPSH